MSILTFAELTSGSAIACSTACFPHDHFMTLPKLCFNHVAPPQFRYGSWWWLAAVNAVCIYLVQLCDVLPSYFLTPAITFWICRTDLGILSQNSQNGTIWSISLEILPLWLNTRPNLFLPDACCSVSTGKLILVVCVLPYAFFILFIASCSKIRMFL